MAVDDPPIDVRLLVMATDPSTREQSAQGGSKSPIKVVVVTNVPAPYRVPVWQRVAKEEGIDLEVVYCAPSHIDPSLDAAAHGFKTHFLQGPHWVMERRFLHADIGVVRLLDRLKPDVVVTSGFIPTFLFAFAWARRHGAAHVAMTDGTLQSEGELSWLHGLARRIVYARSDAFVGASGGSAALYRRYGIADERIHYSCLCADNPRFLRAPSPAAVDFIFCGRFVGSKNPLFCLHVAHAVAMRLGRRTSLDLVGKGPLESKMRDLANTLHETVAVRFLGYASQAELPQRYFDARVFLFPAGGEPWGVVANEACAAGLPVIISPHAGAAGELVIDGHNGLVRPLDVEAWGEAAVSLLTEPDRYRAYASAGRELVAKYSFDNAASGFVAAVRQACRADDARAGGPVAAGPRFPDTSRARATVCIVQKDAKQYRKPFFDRLHRRLAAEGVDLRVIYSAPNDIEALSRDSIELPADYGLKVPAYWPPGKAFVVQSGLRQALAADMVIVEQASKNLINYILLALRALGMVRLAFWGHGRNWQEDGIHWMELVKAALLNRVDWWFAYTRRVADLVLASGYPANRVTTVQNSTDVSEIKQIMSAMDPLQRAALRQSLGIPASAPVGVFCGRMHGHKKLDFLVRAVLEVHAQLPDFHLVLVGAGPSESILRDAAASASWIHYQGPCFGRDKAQFLAVADVFLCPGQMGLAILDAFAAGLPVFTTKVATHSPEIDYLENGVNGFITPVEADAYADAIVAALTQPERLKMLRAAAAGSSARYGLEAMVENFSAGVLACLGRSRGVASGT
jgi:glycosyltransferase involved in cell wall biosynthesis